MPFLAPRKPVVTYSVNETKACSGKVLLALSQAENLASSCSMIARKPTARVGAGERYVGCDRAEGFGSAISTSHGANIDIIIGPAVPNKQLVIGCQLYAGDFIFDARSARVGSQR